MSRSIYCLGWALAMLCAMTGCGGEDDGMQNIPLPEMKSSQDLGEGDNIVDLPLPDRDVDTVIPEQDTPVVAQSRKMEHRAPEPAKVAQQRRPPAQPTRSVPPQPARVDLSDPGPAEAEAVKAYVRQWVGERLNKRRRFTIPPRAGHAVSGAIGEIHTVHMKDADTYTVCVDFTKDAETYDVDFLINRWPNGLAVAEYTLHKVDGQELPSVLDRHVERAKFLDDPI